MTNVQPVGAEAVIEGERSTDAAEHKRKPESERGAALELISRPSAPELPSLALPAPQQAVLTLQRKLGNRAVARTIQRTPPDPAPGGGGTQTDGDAPAPAPAPAGPQNAPPAAAPPTGGGPPSGSTPPADGGSGGSTPPAGGSAPGAPPTGGSGGGPTSGPAPAPAPAPAGPTAAPAPGPAPAPAPAPGTGPAAGPTNFLQFETFWNEHQGVINGVRMGLEVSRLIPGYGLIGGVAADALATVADLMAIPNAGDAPITTGLIIARDALNLVNGATGHILYLTQLVQDGAAISVVGAELLAITAPLNEVLSGIKLCFDGGILILDELVIFGAAYNARQAAPGSASATAWQGIVDGYIGNIMGDLLTTVLDAISFASGGAAQSEIANTGIRPVMNVLTHGGVFKNLVLPVLAGAWNVWGGGVVGAARENDVTGRAQAMAEAVFWGEMVQGLTLVKGGYLVGDALMGVAADMFQKKIAEMNETATILLGGRDPFTVIRNAGQQALANLRTTLDNTVSMRGMAVAAKARVPGIRTTANGLKADIEAIEIPSIDLGRVQSSGGVASDVVAAVANAGLALAQSQLQRVVDDLNSRLTTAKADITGPIDTVLGKLDEATTFLEVVEEQATALVAMITPKITKLEAQLAKCTNATQLIELIVNQILEAVGIGATFSVAEARAAWAGVGPMIDGAIVEATRKQQAALARVTGPNLATPGAAGATSAPPTPPPDGGTAPGSGGPPASVPAATPAVPPPAPPPAPVPAPAPVPPAAPAPAGPAVGPDNADPVGPVASPDNVPEPNPAPVPV